MVLVVNLGEGGNPLEGDGDPLGAGSPQLLIPPDCFVFVLIVIPPAEIVFYICIPLLGYVFMVICIRVFISFYTFYKQVFIFFNKQVFIFVWRSATPVSRFPDQQTEFCRRLCFELSNRITNRRERLSLLERIFMASL